MRVKPLAGPAGDEGASCLLLGELVVLARVAFFFGSLHRSKTNPAWLLHASGCDSELDNALCPSYPSKHLGFWDLVDNTWRLVAMDQSELGCYARPRSLDPFPTFVVTVCIQWL